MVQANQTKMPLAGAVAINSSAPLIATVASVVFLKETVGPVRWGALSVGFLGVLMIASPGFDTFQAGSLFAVANAILFGTAGLPGPERARTLIHNNKPQWRWWR